MTVPFPDFPMDLPRTLADIERQYIELALSATGVGHGKMYAAAKLLGISFRSLRYRMKCLKMGKWAESNEPNASKAAAVRRFLPGEKR